MVRVGKGDKEKEALPIELIKKGARSFGDPTVVVQLLGYRALPHLIEVTWRRSKRILAPIEALSPRCDGLKPTGIVTAFGRRGALADENVRRLETVEGSLPMLAFRQAPEGV